MGESVKDVYQASLKFRRHQFDIYTKGMLGNQLPTITTDPRKLEDQAREAMETKASILFTEVPGNMLQWMQTV